MSPSLFFPLLQCCTCLLQTFISIAIRWEIFTSTRAHRFELFVHIYSWFPKNLCPTVVDQCEIISQSQSLPAHQDCCVIQHHCANLILAGTETVAVETGKQGECPQAQGCEGPVYIIHFILSVQILWLCSTISASFCRGQRLTQYQTIFKKACILEGLCNLKAWLCG